MSLHEIVSNSTSNNFWLVTFEPLGVRKRYIPHLKALISSLYDWKRLEWCSTFTLCHTLLKKRQFITPYKDQRSHSFWVIVFVPYSGKWHFQTQIWPTSANFRQQWPILHENSLNLLNFGIYDFWVELGSLGEKSIWNFNTYQVLEASIFTI